MTGEQAVLENTSAQGQDHHQPNPLQQEWQNSLVDRIGRPINIAPPNFPLSPIADTDQNRSAGPADNEPTYKKVLREGEVVGGGVGRSFLYGIANLPDKLPEIGSSIAIGAGLSAISKSGDLGVAASFVVGAYFTSKFVLNTVNDTERWKKFGAAVEDAWHTNKNVDKDLVAVSDTAGNYTFDTSLSMASGYLGYKNKQLGDLVLSVLRLPIIAPSAALAPAMLGAGMYMDIMPPLGFKKYDTVSPDGKHQSRWDLDLNLHATLRQSDASSGPTIGQPIQPGHGQIDTPVAQAEKR